MSIADVETKHALSRHWADRPFPTLCAKHINQEAVLKVCVCEASSQARSLREVCPSVGSTAPAVQQPRIVGLKEKLRSKSAYMFYRDDMLATARVLEGGTSVNPCTKEFWKQLQDQWAALSPQQGAYYEEKSVQSRHECELQRLQKRKSKEIAEIAFADVDGGANAAASRDEPLHHALQHASMLTDLKLKVPGSGVAQQSVPYKFWVLASRATAAPDMASLASDIASCVRDQQKDACVDLADACLKQSPVSESQLQQWWRSSLDKGHTWAETLQQFNRESQRFTVPPEQAAFPERVA